jgi:hypothetical protein
MKDNSGLAFNGQGGAGYSRGKTGQCVNEYTGKANDGALINKGRGPTGGGTKVPADRDMIRGAAQYRGVGGTTVKKMSPDAKIDMKRGPTKGNQL